MQPLDEADEGGLLVLSVGVSPTTPIVAVISCSEAAIVTAAISTSLMAAGSLVAKASETSILIPLATLHLVQVVGVAEARLRRKTLVALAWSAVCRGSWSALLSS